MILTAAILNWTYAQQSTQQSQLEDRLTQAKQKLAGIKFDDLEVQKEQLTREMEQVNSDLEILKTKLYSDRDSIDAANLVLEEAKNYNVDILDMTSPGLSSESLAGIACEALPLSLKVEGNIKDIVNFVSSLNHRFPTSIDKMVQLDRLPPPESTPTPLPAGGSPAVVAEKDFSASISIGIYSYEGE
jgi:hypothetical protein